MGFDRTTSSGECLQNRDSGQFERCFKERVDTVNEVMEGQVVAIDGKTVSGSHGGTAGRARDSHGKCLGIG